MVALQNSGGAHTKRQREFLEAFQAMAERNDAPAKIMAAILDALKSETSIRVPDPSNIRLGWTYEVVDDHALRLTAARLFAELLGMIAKPGNVSVNLADNSLRVNLGEQLAELESVGGPSVRELREEINTRLDAIEVSAKPADAPKQLEQGAAGGF